MIIVRKNEVGTRRMHDMLAEAAEAGTLQAGGADPRLRRLSTAQPGDRGVIAEVRVERHAGGLAVEELERRLLEFGFVEGARVEVLHEGAIRRDPIAVRLDDMRIALRRRDADDVWVLLEPR